MQNGANVLKFRFNLNKDIVFRTSAKFVDLSNQRADSNSMDNYLYVFL